MVGLFCVVKNIKGDENMKKNLVCLVGLVLLLIGFSANVQAEGAITSEEQKIIDKLIEGFSVNGYSFSFENKTYDKFHSGENITRTKNYLKREGMSTEAINSVINNLEIIYTTISNHENLAVASEHDMPNLWALLSPSAKATIITAIRSIEKTCNLTITLHNDGISIVENIFDDFLPTTLYSSSETAIKNTGTAHWVSLIVFLGSAILAAYILVKVKYQGFALA